MLQVPHPRDERNTHQRHCRIFPAPLHAPSPLLRQCSHPRCPRTPQRFAEPTATLAVPSANTASPGRSPPARHHIQKCRYTRTNRCTTRAITSEGGSCTTSEGDTESPHRCTNRQLPTFPAQTSHSSLSDPSATPTVPVQRPTGPPNLCWLRAAYAPTPNLCPTPSQCGPPPRHR